LKKQGREYESKTWLTKAKNRGLLKDNEFNALNQDVETIGKMLNAYIKSIGKQPVTNDK
jgi:four helix bundle protein